jgi:hypothetical protein
MQQARWLAYSSATIKHYALFLTGPHAIPLPTDPPLFIITAFNPFGKLLNSTVNEARHIELYRAIGGLQANASIIETTGCSSDGQWEEQSWGISGLKLSQALVLAQQFDQEAIFALTEQHKILFASSGILLSIVSRFS